MSPEIPPTEPPTTTNETVADTEPADEPSQTAGHARANGKVARLPKSIRDQINEWIRDGVTYPDIISRLGANGSGLKPGHFSEWKKRGHQDWLAEQRFIERTRARQETSQDLSRDFDGTHVSHAALQLGTLHIFEALRDLGPGTLNQKLGGDSAAFARLLNALSRASRETLQLQKYRDATARARNALQELKDPKRKLNDSETRAIVRKVDEILGLSSADDYPDLSSIGSAKEDLSSASRSASSSALALHSAFDEGGSASDSAFDVQSSDRQSGSDFDVQSSPTPAFCPGEPSVPIQNQRPDRLGPKIENQKSLAPLINTPIHRGESPRPDSSTVSTVSEPATPQSDPRGHPLTHSLIHSFPESPSTTPSLQDSSAPPPHSSPEECHYCRQELPPLLPNGERPHPLCQKCGTALRHPAVRHLYCPRCHGDLRQIFKDDIRTSDQCPYCASVLPPLPRPKPADTTGPPALANAA